MRSIFQRVLLLFSLFMLFYVLLFFVREGTKIANYWTSGSISSNLRLTPDSLLVFNTIDSLDFLQFPLPAAGDTLLTLEGHEARWEEISQKLFSINPPGQVIPVTFRHHGTTYYATLETHRPRRSDFVQVFILNSVRFLLSLSFGAVGVWAFLKRPDSAGVRVLALFCLSMVSFQAFSFNALPGTLASFTMPLWTVLSNFFNLFSTFFGAFWLNLQLLFPKPKPVLKNHPIRIYTLLYLPNVLLLSANQIWPGPSVIWIFVVISLQVTLGFIVLAYSRRRSQDNLEKRQTSLVLNGSGPGMIFLFIMLIVAVGFNEWFSQWKWNVLLVNISLFLLLLSPLSFAYAFGRYRLLEVEGKLKRSTLYATAIITLIAIFVGFLYLTGQVLLHQFGISDRTPIFILALGLAFGFNPRWKRAHPLVERWFYPERIKLRQMLGDFLQKISALPDQKAFWRQIEQRLREALKIKSVYPVLSAEMVVAADTYSPDGGFYLHTNQEQLPTPFRPRNHLVERLKSENRPLLVDEALASRKVFISPEEEEWLKVQKVAMLLPMVTQSKLVGILGLGFKVSQEDYSLEELKILASLAPQVALASENIRLLEENVEKKRLEQEMQLARRIQQGFLPRGLPETPGLELAAESRFCLEVAGDYYDVISLPEGQTVVAVGDVSGKGAAAALLMANLQASLRTGLHTSPKLSSLVAHINDLIHHNTPEEQYITFFVGIFQPTTRRFTYVNAGHNAPLLLRPDHQVEELNQGGLLLGFTTDVLYEEGQVTLGKGDVVILYTDGVSEAKNPAEEEFGEKRILECAQQHQQHCASEILSCLNQSVSDFTSAATLEDDYTLIVMKVVG